MREVGLVGMARLKTLMFAGERKYCYQFFLPLKTAQNCDSNGVCLFAPKPLDNHIFLLSSGQKVPF